MFRPGRMALLVVMIVAFGLSGCIASRGTRYDPNVEVVTSHEFNPKDLQIIGQKAVEKLLAQEVFKANRPVLYVANIRNLTNEHIKDEMIREYIAVEIVNRGHIRLVERNAARDEALKELDFQQGAMVDQTTVRRLGKQIGAGYFLQGTLMNMENTAGRKKGQYFFFVLTLVDVETLESHKSRVEIQKLSKRGLFGW